MNPCKYLDCGFCFNKDVETENGECHMNCEHYEEKNMPTVPIEISKAEMTAEDRKQRPLFHGVLQYFPRALMEVAHCSWLGNEQHNPGKPLHWDRSKSGDELDALTRHLTQVDEMDDDGSYHAAKVAWRALAYLEKKLETDDANV